MANILTLYKSVLSPGFRTYIMTICISPFTQISYLSFNKWTTDCSPKTCNVFSLIS